MTAPVQSSPFRLLVGRWVAIYPTITLLLLGLGPLLFGRFPTPVITLILTGILVPLTHYFVYPLVERLTGGWVRFPAQHGPAHHRTAIVVWAVTYPLITLVLLFVLHLLHGKTPIPLLTLAVTLIAIPIQSLVLLPALMPRVRGWIQQGNSPLTVQKENA